MGLAKVMLGRGSPTENFILLTTSTLSTTRATIIPNTIPFPEVRTVGERSKKQEELCTLRLPSSGQQETRLHSPDELHQSEDAGLTTAESIRQPSTGLLL